jgi:hypothetical protein
MVRFAPHGGCGAQEKAKPKKPRSAYMVYLDRHRQMARDSNPEMQQKELTALLATNWQSVQCAPPRGPPSRCHLHATERERERALPTHYAH